MLTNRLEFFLDVFFELTIFALLIIFLVSLIKKYALPILHQTMRVDLKKEEELKEKRELLSESKKNLDKEIDKQQVRFFKLKKKVKICYDFIQKENEKENLEFLKRSKLIEEKRYKQKENLALLKMQEIVIPRSIKLASKEIVEKYSGQKGLDLLKELVTKINIKT